MCVIFLPPQFLIILWILNKSIYLMLPSSGTRVVYERNFLLHLRNSPLSRTPPTNLPNIPESVLKGSVDRPIISPPKENGIIAPSPVKKGKFFLFPCLVF